MNPLVSFAFTELIPTVHTFMRIRPSTGRITAFPDMTRDLFGSSNEDIGLPSRAGVPLRQQIAIFSTAPTATGECIICIEETDKGIVLPCGHVYHEKCIRVWMNKNKTCPICRVVIKERVECP